MSVPLDLARSVLARPCASAEARVLAQALLVEHERVRYALALFAEERARRDLQAAQAANEPADMIAFWQARADEAHDALEACRDALDAMGARYCDGHDR